MRSLSNRAKYLRANLKLASTILKAALVYHETFSKHYALFLKCQEGGGGQTIMLCTQFNKQNNTIVKDEIF